MKKHSTNTLRRKRREANRLKIRQRFISGGDEALPSSRLPQRRLHDFFLANKSTVISCLMFSLAFTSLAASLFIYNQGLRPDPTTLACQLDSSELRSFDTVAKAKQKVPTELSKKIAQITKNTPMAKMADEIARQEKTVAAFIVGIAMKESKFGKYSPKKNGKDCYNYWGYRGKENTTASGYSCFSSPSMAVATIGKKIAVMVRKGARTPASMISWKCGSSCAGHDPQSVTKWIADVGINYYQLARIDS